MSKAEEKILVRGVDDEVYELGSEVLSGTISFNKFLDKVGYSAAKDKRTFWLNSDYKFFISNFDKSNSYADIGINIIKNNQYVHLLRNRLLMKYKCSFFLARKANGDNSYKPGPLAPIPEFYSTWIKQDYKISAKMGALFPVEWINAYKSEGQSIIGVYIAEGMYRHYDFHEMTKKESKYLVDFAEKHNVCLRDMENRFYLGEPLDVILEKAIEDKAKYGFENEYIFNKDMPDFSFQHPIYNENIRRFMLYMALQEFPDSFEAEMYRKEKGIK